LNATVNHDDKDLFIVYGTDDIEHGLHTFFHTDYIYKTRANRFGNIGGEDQILTFTQTVNDCTANILFDVENQLGEWLPLTIDTQTLVDSSFYTNLQFMDPHYLPFDDYPELKEYLKFKTNITLRIFDVDTNQEVYYDSVIINEFYDDPANVVFNWDNTFPGNFSVEMISHIIDPKCSSVEDDIETQQVEVFPELPDEVCVIVTDSIDFDPSSPERTEQTDVNIGSYYYFIDKQYKGEFESLQEDDPDWYDIYLVYNPITADYTITYDHPSEIVVESDTLSEAWTGQRVNQAPEHSIETLTWTPNYPGDYDVTIEMTSSDTLCPLSGNDFSRGTRTNSVVVQGIDADGDGYHDLVDCDDTDPNINPGATDTCDGIDNDCDGIDNNCPCNIDGESIKCSLLGGIGVCGLGNATCVNNDWEGCALTSVGLLGGEICNNIDHNCKGQPDKC